MAVISVAILIVCLAAESYPAYATVSGNRNCTQAEQVNIHLVDEDDEPVVGAVAWLAFPRLTGEGLPEGSSFTEPVTLSLTGIFSPDLSGVRIVTSSKVDAVLFVAKSNRTVSITPIANLVGTIKTKPIWREIRESLPIRNLWPNWMHQGRFVPKSIDGFEIPHSALKAGFFDVIVDKGTINFPFPVSSTRTLFPKTQPKGCKFSVDVSSCVKKDERLKKMIFEFPPIQRIRFEANKDLQEIAGKIVVTCKSGTLGIPSGECSTQLLVTRAPGTLQHIPLSKGSELRIIVRVDGGQRLLPMPSVFTRGDGTIVVSAKLLEGRLCFVQEPDVKTAGTTDFGYDYNIDDESSANGMAVGLLLSVTGRVGSLSGNNVLISPQHGVDFWFCPYNGEERQEIVRGFSMTNLSEAEDQEGEYRVKIGNMILWPDRFPRKLRFALSRKDGRPYRNAMIQIRTADAFRVVQFTNRLGFADICFDDDSILTVVADRKKIMIPKKYFGRSFLKLNL